MAGDGVFFAPSVRRIPTQARFVPLSVASLFMVSVRFSFVVLVLGVSVVFTAQGQDEAPITAAGVPADTVGQRISTAFERGNAQALLTPAADRVKVSLFGAQTIYSDAQAFYVLRAFFEQHPPARFTLTDVAKEEQSCFVRGTFEHRRDERTFQAYVRLVPHKGTWQVQEIRVDEDAG